MAQNQENTIKSTKVNDGPKTWPQPTNS